MKRNLIFLFLFVTLFAITSCDDDNPLSSDGNGKLSLTSNPSGAMIFLNGVNTGNETPDTLEATEGIHEIKLVKENYADTTFTFGFQANQVGIVTVELRAIVSEISVNSNPVGATIWINGTNTGEVTPFIFSNKISGEYEITLKAENYEDYTGTVTVGGGSEANVNAELTPLYSAFSTIKLWETVGTTPDQPSGLDLSTSDALSITVSNGVNGTVDIYYSSDGFIVRSSNGHNQMTRETYFKVAAGSDLADGVDSPVKDGNWTTQIADTETSYIFLYDADGNYSKLKIVNRGGGNAGGADAWVELSWIYNKAVDNTKF